MNFLIGLSIVFIFLTVMIIFKLSPSDLEKASKDINLNKSLKQLSTINTNKKSKITEGFKRLNISLKMIGHQKYIYTIIFITLILIFLGIITGTSFSNPFLIPVFIVALASLPYVYIRSLYLNYKNLLMDEMGIALSVITSSYERSENIISAFEENTDFIGEPLKSVFQDFLVGVNNVGLNLEDCLESMKDKIQNPIFSEWIDNLKRCAKDRNLKVSLKPTVDRIREIKNATESAKVILFEVRREFWTVLIIAFVFMWVTYSFLPFNLGMTIEGSLIDMIFAGNLLVIVICSIRVFFLTKDLSFEI